MEAKRYSEVNQRKIDAFVNRINRKGEVFSMRDPEIAVIGNVPIVSVGLGAEKTNEDLMRNEAIPQELKPVIGAFGFDTGHRHPNDYDPASETAIEENANQALQVIEGLLEFRGWENMDRLFFSSVSVHPQVIKRVEAQLRASGRIGEKSTIHYGMACDGGAAMMLDAAVDQSLQDKRVLIIAQEVLSGKHAKDDDPVLSGLFADSIGGMAFVPGRDFMVVPGMIKAVIKRDKKGVIKLPRSYKLEEYRGREVKDLPAHYTWANDDDRQAVVMTDDAFLMEMPTDEINPEKASMEDGPAVGIFFKNMALPLMAEVMKRYYDERDEPVEHAITHMPSLPIILNFARNFPLFYKKITGKDIELEIPWLMTDKKRRNSSSATFFVALISAIEQGVLKTGELNLFGGFGIGALAHAAVGMYVEEE